MRKPVRKAQLAYNARLRQLRNEQLRKKATQPPARRRLSLIDIAARFRYTDIAKAVGVSTSAVAFWFTGRSQPGFLQGLDLCRFLDVTPTQLEEFLLERITARSQRTQLERVRAELPGIRAAYLDGGGR